MVITQQLVDRAFRQIREKTDYQALMANLREYAVQKAEENRRKEPAFGEIPEKVTVEPCGTGPFRTWWIRREGNPQDKILFYIHGGGFIGGSTSERADFVFHAVTHWKLDVFSVDYRLAPEYKAPVQSTDCMEAYRSLLRQRPKDRIAVFGESAGATLALTTVLWAKEEGLRLPDYVVVNAPVVQGEEYAGSWITNYEKDNIVFKENVELMYELYSKEARMDDPHIWPKYGDYRGFPPVRIEVSDMECLYDDSVLLDRLVREAGGSSTLIVRNGLLHAHLISPSIEGYLTPIRETGADILKHL